MEYQQEVRNKKKRRDAVTSRFPASNLEKNIAEKDGAKVTRNFHPKNIVYYVSRAIPINLFHLKTSIMPHLFNLNSMYHI